MPSAWRRRKRPRRLLSAFHNARYRSIPDFNGDAVKWACRTEERAYSRQDSYPVVCCGVFECDGFGSLSV